MKDFAKIIDYLEVGSLHFVISYFWCAGVEWGGWIEIEHLRRRGMDIGKTLSIYAGTLTFPYVPWSRF